VKTTFLYDKSWYNFLVTKAVSVRLDEETQRALVILEASGLSRSEAIREAILSAAADTRRRQALRKEVAVLEADEDDRREMLETAAFMELLRAEG
jgi:antitoxin component of RelBE/YafQ-DinJ toxin-antitoxin module